MIKKILCILFCTIVIVTVFPLSSMSKSTDEINKFISGYNPEEIYDLSTVKHTPAYMPIPTYPLVKTKTAGFHPSFELSYINDNIIQMIDGIDESLIQGYLEDLVAFGPRVTETSQCIDAAEYIYNEFNSMGLDVRYHSWDNYGYSSNNVEAIINGTDKNSNEIYIVCGHYDTAYDSPGADDDGSGTITAIVAAYVMSQYAFNHTIRFVAFSGEEEGLLGSQIYAAEAAAQGWNIAGVLNADMIGFASEPNDENFLRIYEDDASEWLYTFTNNVNNLYDEYIQLDLIHEGWTWGSDHNSFWDNGYSALFYQEYHFSEVYHSPDDTIENMNIPYMTKGVKLITATLAELAEPLTNHPPEKPDKPTGNANGKTGVKYTYESRTIDLEGNQVFYKWNWGDGKESDWIGPYDSGVTAYANHTWSDKGTYAIKVKARDNQSQESDWSDPLYVSMPRNKILINSLLQRFFQNHPNIFPILQKLLNRLGQ